MPDTASSKLRATIFGGSPRNTLQHSFDGCGGERMSAEYEQRLLTLVVASNGEVLAKPNSDGPNPYCKDAEQKAADVA